MAGKLDTEDLMNIAMFEKLTGAQVVDCISNEAAMYVVIGSGNIGAIIGKDGIKIKEIQDRIGKQVKIFKFSKDAATFIKNMVHGDVRAVHVDGKKAVVEVDRRTRPRIVGQGGKNIKIMKEFLKRNFSIDTLVIR